MGKRIRDYVKYSLNELENYAQSSASCVHKINSPIHLNFPPYGLTNFRKTLQEIIAQRKIGFYDPLLKGIILDIRKIKVMNDLGAMRFDDPSIHLNLRADCYVFQPAVGAIVRGLVKHISERQIGVIIYRVFSVSIRLNGRVPEEIKLNSEIEFRIKQFDLENVMPFIEGELVTEACGEIKQEAVSNCQDVKPNIKKRKLKFENCENASSGYNSDHSPDLKTSKTPFKSDPDDSDADSNYVEPSQRARSPDLFSELSAAECEEERRQPKIKKEKSTQESLASYIEPFQKMKHEKLSQEASSAVAKSERSSDIETPRKRLKAERISHSQIKTEQLSQNNDGNDLDTTVTTKQETDTVRRKKSSKRIKCGENMPDHGNDTSLCHDISTDTLLDQSICSNVRDDADNSTASSSKKKEKRKRKKEDASITEIYLDSDFEMTYTTPGSKHKKKKKKSKEAPDSSFEAKNSTFLDPNAVIDVGSLLHTTEKKKKKEKSKDRDEERINDDL